MITLKHGSIIRRFSGKDRIAWIPEYEGLYAACEAGYILSFIGRRAKRLKSILQKQSNGREGFYYKVCLCRNKVQRNYKVAELILITFVGPRPEGMIVCHYDDDPKNNKPSNLRWDTHRENNLDALRNNKSQNQTLSVKEVIEVKKRLQGVETRKKIAFDYGVHASTIGHIDTGYTWNHV